MIPKFNKKEQLYLKGVGKKYLLHPSINKWFNYFIKKYKPPIEKKYILFMPCSWGKPYSQSYIHYFIIKTLEKLKFYNAIHQVIVSNAGIIPREFETYYPFVAYDWNPKLETPEIKKLYLEVTTKRLRKYLAVHGRKYKHVFCYFRIGTEEMEALKTVTDQLNLPLTICLRLATFQRFADRKYQDLDEMLIERECLMDLYLSIKNKTEMGE